MSNTKTEKATKNVANASGIHALSFKDLSLDSSAVATNVKTQFAIWIRTLLQGWRQGTVGCKGRSDVNRTNKKPWKQKGTGRARAGSARSPLWRGGGIIFGPQPRTRTLRVTQHLKKNVMQSMLVDALSKGKVVSLDWTPGETPKTASAYAALKQAHIAGKLITVFVTMDDVVTQASFANIPQVHVICFDQPNAMFLARSDYWVFLTKNTEDFKGMASRWI